jgi:hypothetical protein
MQIVTERESQSVQGEEASGTPKGDTVKRRLRVIVLLEYEADPMDYPDGITARQAAAMDYRSDPNTFMPDAEDMEFLAAEYVEIIHEERQTP